LLDVASLLALAVIAQIRVAVGHRGEFYRLIAIAADALQRKGVPAASLKDHVIALNVGNIVTVITRPDAFTAAE
jgi:hypothetical protein